MEQQVEFNHDRARMEHTPPVNGIEADGWQGFYDPVNDKFTEPQHTGISYSFSADGHFEEAYYRAVANRTLPQPLPPRCAYRLACANKRCSNGPSLSQGYNPVAARELPEA